ncbi:hypothetical protein [Nocardia colli]|uniref:hypothetical protein n=1 Tax=Nocardia colli TaxID=2545717 RepID=UPI0035E253B1
MITPDDACDGYVFLPDRIGVEGGMLLLDSEHGTVHIQPTGDGFNINVYPSRNAPRGKRLPGLFWASRIENARRVGAKMLDLIADGVNIGAYGKEK